jgi:3-oxoacyl-[acyl-carrier protein] reductase
MASLLNLSDRVAVVTGATRGIGWATARLIAQHGGTVILTGGAQTDLLEQRKQQLRAAFDTPVDALRCDAGSPTEVRDLYAEIFKRHRRLDILVNNAGVLEDSLLGMVSPTLVAKTFHVNVDGVLFNMQYASRMMARQKSGSIVNVSSIIGQTGNVGQTVYGGSKAAVIGMTLSAAKELAPSGIRVNAVAPGFIETDMTKALSPEKYRERLQSIKMGRIGTAEDVGQAILFLVSDMSAYITGQVLGVNGGMLI